MEEYVVCVIGSYDIVGKTALTLQFVDNIFHAKHSPTTVDYYTRVVNIDCIATVHLNIIDSAGFLHQ